MNKDVLGGQSPCESCVALGYYIPIGNSKHSPAACVYCGGSGGVVDKVKADLKKFEDDRYNAGYRDGLIKASRMASARAGKRVCGATLDPQQTCCEQCEYCALTILSHDIRQLAKE